MSDGSISQAEIDALLGGGSSSSGAADAGGAGTKGFGGVSKFVDGNISQFSSKLGVTTGSTASFTKNAVEEKEKDAFLQMLPDMVVVAYIDFAGTMQGGHTFILAEDFAKKIIGLVNHEENVEIDDMGLSIVSESASQFVGAQLTALEQAGLKGVESSTPTANHVPKAAVNLPITQFLSVSYDVKLADADYKMWEIFALDVANKIEETISGPKVAPQQAASPMGMPQMSMQAMGGQMMSGGQMMGGGMPVMNNPNVQAVQFSPLQNFTSQAESGNIGLIMDVYMEMTVELGRTKKMIKEILGMGEGHIIELDKLAGEPVDILVNHKPIAKGEVVVIEENFGVRVTEILSPTERIADV